MPRPPLPRPPRVLVAGHDLKFFGQQAAALRARGAVVRYDHWDGHDAHDEAESEELLADADVIVAQWCLGNAVWYARNRRPGQRLIVHFHRFEYDTPYPARLDVDNVDLVVFAGPHVRDEAARAFGWPLERLLYVPNPVDVAAFDQPKDAHARHTLGLLGYDRQLKRLDLALTLLARLRAADPRFRLRVRGAPGRGAGAFFAQQRERILTDPALRDAVVMEGFDADVVGFFRGVGVVLSLSDIESFHLALAEGMASRCVPVIRDRPGARELWPRQWVHDDLDTMTDAILASAAGDMASEGEQARAFVAGHYASDDVAEAWIRLCGVDRLDAVEAALP